jgi:hypothetical protein
MARRIARLVEEQEDKSKLLRARDLTVEVERMDLGMFDRFCPSLKTRAQPEERRYDMNRSDINSGRYVIPMHRKNCWTNKWMQDPRNNFLQVHYCDPSA